MNFLFDAESWSLNFLTDLSTGLSAVAAKLDWVTFLCAAGVLMGQVVLGGKSSELLELAQTKLRPGPPFSTTFDNPPDHPGGDDNGERAGGRNSVATRPLRAPLPESGLGIGRPAEAAGGGDVVVAAVGDIVVRISRATETADVGDDLRSHLLR